jgi:ubiquinone/menaquinone biosynthesis C-methylase UbiE
MGDVRLGTPGAGSYAIPRSGPELDRVLERLRAQVLVGWEKEARLLAWYGLQDGMSVLELGSGPGFVTAQLLALLPNSAITSLEASSVMIDKARQYLGAGFDDRLGFVEASIMDTGLPDDSFDFALARMLFRHLPDPVGAATEVRRILRPGGKLVITDIDDAVWGLTDPGVPEMSLILEKFRKAQAAGGGDRWIGRRLWRVLEAAAFVNLDVDVTIAHSDALGLEPFMPQFDLRRLSFLVKSGALSEQEMEQIQVSREAFLGSDRPYIMMLNWMVCGQKP